MPDVRLIPYPIDPRPAGASPWWSDGQMIRAVGREYVKYLRCTARMQVAQILHRISGGRDIMRSVMPPR